MGSFDRVVVVPGDQQTQTEERIVQLLVQRLDDLTCSRIAVSSSFRPADLREGGLAVLLGVPERHVLLADLLRAQSISPPTAKDPGVEGYLIQSISPSSGTILLAAGTDERGLLYAVGEILRQTYPKDDRLQLPANLHIRTAPAFRTRGLIVTQGHTMREITGAREWTEDEWQRAVLDYALAGANTYNLPLESKANSPKFDFLKSYGLDGLVSWSVNVGSGPEEWQAVEAIGRTGYLCPSVPEARQAILGAWEARWQNAPAYDHLRIKSADGGGCECEKCRPFGAVYIKLCEDMSKIVHKYSPNTRIQVANQKLDNASDQAILDHLNSKPSPWMDAFCYGPGSNAMGWMPGRRQDHRMDLFEYPGVGPHGRYLQEILHQLPGHIDIIFFTDLTHWVYSQYGLMDHELIPDRNRQVPPHWGHWLYDARPDPAFEQVYNRRTFFALPRRYYRVFQESIPYAAGEVAYSEGHHDHVITWMWQRLLWSPHRTVEEVIGEYARTWFGQEAADIMTEAILLLEKNTSGDQVGTQGVDRLVDLVKEAGERIPPEQLKTNYLWHQYMQKAILDRYVKLREGRQFALQEEAERILRKGLKSDATERAVEKVLERWDEDIETREMKDLRAEAGRLGDESERIFGVRNVGFFNLDCDLVGLGWLKAQLKRAAHASEEDRRSIVELVVNYENPGDGGFYDNAGDPEDSPHLVYGWPYGDGGFSPANRRSQRSMAFTTDEDTGVTFEYRDLDPEAQYRVRFTLVRPMYLPRYAMNHEHTTQSVYADNVCLAKDLELPPYHSEFFEFDIPKEVTQDGTLRLWFQKSDGVGEGPESERTVWRNTGGWGTLCSEVWLMRES